MIHLVTSASVAGQDALCQSKTDAITNASED